MIGKIHPHNQLSSNTNLIELFFQQPYTEANMMNRKNIFHSFLLVIFLITSVLSPIAMAQQTGARDFELPKISHWLEQQVALEGEEQRISAVVKDNNEVGDVVLHYRVVGQLRYKSIQMLKDQSTGIYVATVAARFAKAPGIEYFIEARDIDENIAYKAAPDEPLKLKLMSRPVDSPAPATDVTPESAIVQKPIVQPLLPSKSEQQGGAPVVVGAEAAAITAVSPTELSKPQKLPSKLDTTLEQSEKESILSQSNTETDVKTETGETAPNEPVVLEKKSSKKWLWIGLGVLAAGVVASSMGSDDEPTETSILTIQAEPPQ